MKNIVLLLFVALISVSTTVAQDFVVRGFVYNKDNGEPIEFAKVLLIKADASESDQPIGATTNLDGFFSFAKVMKGDYTILIRNMEFNDLEQTISVGDKEILSLTFELEKPDDVKQIEQIDIYAEDRSKKTRVEISTIKLDQKGLERLPSFGAENDIVSAFAVTPGCSDHG